MQFLEILAYLVQIAVGLLTAYQVVRELRGKDKRNELDPPGNKDDPE